MENGNNASNPDNLTTEYLQELFRDKKIIQSNGLSLKHTTQILDKEINRVKEYLFKTEPTVNGNEPIAEGKVISKQEKIFLPVKENPNYNFVGRILGPRGYTAKQLEQRLDCKIMIRGRGSMRDHSKEEQNRGKPNWEHLNQELHVLVSITDYENRIDNKASYVCDSINKFIEEGLSTPESQDTLKQMQLMELSILNENDRIAQQQRQQAILQQSAAMQINQNLINQNLLKLPMIPMSFGEHNQDLSHLLTNSDPLQYLSLNPQWTIINPMIQHDNTLNPESLLPVSNDQNAVSLMSLLNNPNNLTYMNYGLPGPLKLRTDQRNHPYSRST